MSMNTLRNPMFDDFIVRALVAGIGIALITGVLGCFIVWRKMAYFGDSLAHSAVLGIAIGIVFSIQFNITILIISLGFSLLLLWLQNQRILASDTLLGILAHASLSLGMVVISFVDNASFNLHSALFGDILSVLNSDIYWIYGTSFFTLIVLLYHWSTLTLMSVSEDLAKAEGCHTVWGRFVIIILLAIVVSAAIQVVGILLITSLLIIPAATARQVARSPEMMALIASVIGVLSVVGGVFSSIHFDTPSGPSIVTTAALIFTLTLTINRLFNSHQQ